MIFVDTSVWLEVFRGRDLAADRHLRMLIDEGEVHLAAPVPIEILAGASRSDAPRLRRLLHALPIHQPTQATWDRIEGWVLAAAAAGQRFGVVDLLIGALASERQAPVWSLDGDFERMAKLRFVGSYRFVRT